MEAEEDEEDERSDYFYRLMHLVLDLGTEVLLNFFKKHIPQSQTVEAFLISKENDLKKPKKVLNDLQEGILNARPIDVSRFDISLLYILISKLTHIQPPNGDWYRALPMPSDRSAGAQLMNFRLVRNEAIAHWPKCTMKKTDFEIFWKRTESSLVDLAGEISPSEKDHVTEKVKEIRTKQLIEDQRCKLNTQIIGKLQEDTDLLKQKMEEQERMSGDVDTLKSSLEILEVQLKDLENNIDKFDDISKKQVDQQSQISEDVDTMKISFKHLETTLQGLKSDMSKKMEEQERMSGDVDTLKSSLEILDNQLKDIKNKIEKFDDVSKKVEQQRDLTVEVDNMSSLIRNLEAKLHSLKCDKSQFEDIARQVDEHSSKLQALKDQLIGQEAQASFPAEEKGNDKMKHSFKKELIDHYLRNGYCKTYIAALIENTEVDIEQLFVKPLMKKVKHVSSPKSFGNKNEEEDSKSTTLLEDIFREDGQLIRRVCISGDAGQGKTSLCKKIVSSWCKIHANREHIPDVDEQFLKLFDYLFYIPLRNHAISDVVKMIQTDIVRNGLHNVLEMVLKNESEKCLIILDGLDEWQSLEHKVPYIDPREKFTVLLTSRPWKLEVSRPNMSEIGQEAELCWINKHHIVEGLVKLLNTAYGKGKDWHGFMWNKEHGKQGINDQYKKVKDLIEIPIVLTHMVCMWYDDKEFGNTRVEIYSEMLEFLFNVAFKRDQKRGTHACTAWANTQQSSNATLLYVFKGYKYCDAYSEILSKLSMLAYHTLFNEEKQNYLVFSHTVTELYKLTEKDVKFCLSVGILSQSTFRVKALSLQKKLSFIHKTVQEFLAAIFIAYVGDDTCLHLMLKTLLSLDDVFEMSHVLIFVSGLKPILIGDISRHIARLTDEDERVLKYRRTLWKEELFVTRVQDIIKACIDEVPTYKRIYFNVTLNDYFPFGRFGWEENMVRHLNLKHVKSFQQERCFAWTQLSGHDIVKLCVDINSQEHICDLTSIVERCVLSLECLSVEGPSTRIHNVGSTPSDTVFVNVNDLLTGLYKVCQLTCLKLTYMSLTHSDIDNIRGILSHKTKLRQIRLGCIQCTECERGRCNYTIDLSHHTQLQYVSIGALDGAIVLTNEVPLEHCEIDCVKHDVSIIKGLKLSSSLQELNVRGVPTLYRKRDCTTTTVNSVEGDVTPQVYLNNVLTDAIPTLKALKILQLDFIDFKQSILNLCPDMTGLKKVFFSNCTMSLQCLQGFIDSLPQTQLEIIMRNVSICPNEDWSTALKYITDRYIVKQFNIAPKQDDSNDTEGYKDKYHAIHLKFNHNGDN